MSKYTAEHEIIDLFVVANDENLSIPTKVLRWLRDYATLLRERESAKAAVTDEMVLTAIRAWDGVAPQLEYSHRFRAALEAVAPMLEVKSLNPLTEYQMEKLADAAAALDKLGRRDQCARLMEIHEALTGAPMLASARVPDEKEDLDPVRLRREGRVATEWERGFNEGWNDCRETMLAAATKPETEE